MRKKKKFVHIISLNKKIEKEEHLFPILFTYLAFYNPMRGTNARRE